MKNVECYNFGWSETAAAATTSFVLSERRHTHTHSSVHVIQCYSARWKLFGYRSFICCCRCCCCCRFFHCLIVTAFALTTMITKSHIKFALKVEHNVSLLWEMQKKCEWVRASVSMRQSRAKEHKVQWTHYTMLAAECSDCGDAPTEHWYEWEIMIGSKNMNWRRTTARVYEFCRFVATTATAASAARLPKYV